MESKSFPSNFDIARRYAKHRKQHYLRYGEQRYYEIRVLEDIDVEFGKVIPWHNHSGNGMQIKFSKDIKDLVDTKKIEIINIKKLK